MEKFGEDNIEVYHTNFQPLEYTVAERDNNDCYAKIICNKDDDVSKALSNQMSQIKVHTFENSQPREQLMDMNESQSA